MSTLPVPKPRDVSIYEVADAFGGYRNDAFESLVPRLAEKDDDRPLTIEEGLLLARSECDRIRRAEASLVWHRWRLGFVLWHCGTVYGESTVSTFSRRLQDAGYQGVGQTTLYNAMRMVRKLDGNTYLVIEKIKAGELATWSLVLQWLDDERGIAEDPARFVDSMIRRAESGAVALGKANDAVDRIPDQADRDDRRRQIFGVAKALHDETSRASGSATKLLPKANPLRSPFYLDFVRHMPCAASGVEPPSEVVLLDDSSDWTAIPLEGSLAKFLRRSRYNFERKTGLDPRSLIAETLHKYASGIWIEIR